MLSIGGVKFHERIAHWRNEAGLSQAALAKRCKVKPAAVGQWETGDTYPRVDRLPKLAAVLGVTVSALTDGVAHYESLRNALGTA